MIKISMKEMFEAGAHFGHQTRRWNPKMREFIYTKRRGIHIIDLKSTAQHLAESLKKLYQIAAAGHEVIFVCTKSGVNETVATQAIRAKTPYIKRRWLGGFLTNWETVSSRIKHLNKLEADRKSGAHDRYTKKEQLMIDRKIERLNMFLGGVKNMTGLPGAIIVFDTCRDRIAVIEAKKSNITVIGLSDSNSDPDLVDYSIPANDDALKSVEYFASIFADTIIAAQQKTPKVERTPKPAAKQGDIEVPDAALAEKGDQPN